VPLLRFEKAVLLFALLPRGDVADEEEYRAVARNPDRVCHPAVGSDPALHPGERFSVPECREQPPNHSRVVDERCKMGTDERHPVRPGEIPGVRQR